MTTIYGIKNCDSVKKARKWLEAQNINYTFHDFREQGLTEEMVKEWLQVASLDKLVNKRSTSWKQLDEESKAHLTNETAPALCARFETLIKRPVLSHNEQLHLGFNEKIYSQIFS